MNTIFSIKLSPEFPDLSESEFNQLQLTVLSYSQFKELKSLDNLTYQYFLSLFPVYPSLKEARCPGFEAHHIIPLNIQRKLINQKYSCKLKNRHQLLASPYKNEIDDRCIRCTAFEHILVHYLAARDLGSDYLLAFNAMIIQYNKKLTVIEQSVLKYLEAWSQVIKQGKDLFLLKEKSKYRELTPEEYQEYCQKRREGWAKQTPEQREHFRQSRFKSNGTITAKKNFSLGQQRHYAQMTEADWQKHNAIQKAGKNTDMAKDRRQKKKEAYQLYKQQLNAQGLKADWNTFSAEYSKEWKASPEYCLRSKDYKK